MSDEQESARAESTFDSLRTFIYVLLASLLFSLLALVLAQGKGPIAAAAICVLIFETAFASGALLGFLFGMPRVLSQETSPAPTADEQAQADNPAMGRAPPQPQLASSKTRKSRFLQSNTNLERISDWLTTLLVGAGLVQIHNVNDALLRFRVYLGETAAVFPNEDGTFSAGIIPMIGPIVLIFGAALGFLYMYISTRLVLVLLFAAIESRLAGETTLTGTAGRAVKAVALGAEEGASFIVDQMKNKRALTVDDGLNVMFDLLYKGDPDRVIDLGAQLKADAANRADYWFYLAAAFGQKLHSLEERKGSDEWISARDNALDCARRAVALNPAYRARLWSISDPNKYDNDLSPLRNDPEFKRLVGREDE